MTACPAHDLTEHRRKARPSARLTRVQARSPVRPVDLADRTDQYLVAARDRPHPRSLTLVGIVGGSAAEGAPGTGARPHAAKDTAAPSSVLLVHHAAGRNRHDHTRVAERAGVR